MRTLDEESRLSSPEGEGEGASERRFVLSLTQDAPDRDRRQTEGGREGESATPDFGSARPRPREIDLSPRYVHQEAGLAKPCPVCRTPGCPAVGLSLALPSFVWGGGVGVGQLPRKSSGHYARAAFPLVCPPTPEK